MSRATPPDFTFPESFEKKPTAQKPPTPPHSPAKIPPAQIGAFHVSFKEIARVTFYAWITWNALDIAANIVTRPIYEAQMKREMRELFGR